MKLFAKFLCFLTFMNLSFSFEEVKPFRNSQVTLKPSLQLNIQKSEIEKILLKDGLRLKPNKHEKKSYQHLFSQCQIPDKKNFWKFFIESWLVSKMNELHWANSYLNHNLRQNLELILSVSTKERRKSDSKKFKILYFSHQIYPHFAFFDGSETLIALNSNLIIAQNLNQWELGIEALELLNIAQANFFKREQQNHRLVKRISTQCTSKKYAFKLLNNLHQEFHAFLLKENYRKENIYSITAKTIKTLELQVHKKSLLKHYLTLSQKRKSIGGRLFEVNQEKSLKAFLQKRQKF